MGITDADVARIAELAGVEFNYAGVRGSSRPAADVRTELRADLWDRQGNVCPFCGNGANGDALEFCHVVSRGPNVKGFIPGNIATGHAACNARTKPIYDETGTLISGVEVLTLDYIARPDVIATEWTPFPILRERRKARRA